MSIKFLYPSESKKDVLDELNKIVENLQKKPDPVLKKNIRFVKSFTKAMFVTAVKQKKREQVNFRNLPIHLPIQKKEIKEKKQALSPPPPPSPPSASSAFKKENNALVYTKLEPDMTDKDLELYNKVIPQIQKNPDKQDEIIAQEAKKMDIEISKQYVDKIKQYLEKNLKKFGILTPLMEEPRISVIDVNPYGKVNATYDNEYLPVNIKFDSKQDLIKLQKILANHFNYPLKKESQINIRSPGIKITGIHSNTSPVLKIEKLKQ